MANKYRGPANCVYASIWKERDLAGELSTQNACCMASELVSAPPSGLYFANLFFTFPARLPTELAFKAKKEAFRGKGV